ncbi:MAG TPA: DMT family transporter [Terracidiphilus sp.]|nr:DMT family transporter [Terracidiphilus sp.]
MRPRASHIQAIGLAIAGFTFWVLTDSTLKVIGRSRLSPLEILAFMGLVVCAALAAWTFARGEGRALRPVQPKRQIVRSCLDLTNNVCVVIALRHMPLTLFYILVFTSPMVITILAAIFLKERLEMRKAIAIVAGFAAVVVALDPWGGTTPGDRIGYLACMICVACFSVNMVWSRVLTQTETPESLAFFSGLIMTLAGGVAMVIHAEPIGGRLLGELIAMGVFCAAGTLCFYTAVKHTSASNVSQYHYTQLLSGALISYLVWRELPTFWMELGGVLIIVAGLYIAWLAAQAGANEDDVYEHPV